MSDELPDLIAEATEVLRLTAATGHKMHGVLSATGASQRELDELSADIHRRITLARKLDAAAARLRGRR